MTVLATALMTSLSSDTLASDQRGAAEPIDALLQKLREDDDALEILPDGIGGRVDCEAKVSEVGVVLSVEEEVAVVHVQVGEVIAVHKHERDQQLLQPALRGRSLLLLGCALARTGALWLDELVERLLADQRAQTVRPIAPSRSEEASSLSAGDGACRHARRSPAHKSSHW